MNLEMVRKNWSIIMVIVAMIYGWATIQMDITQMKKDITATEIELAFTKSQYYAVDNKITELRVEVKNLQKNSDRILTEIQSLH